MSDDLRAGAARRTFEYNLDAVPDLMKQCRRWVVWQAGPLKDNGKFDKVPISPETGLNINGQNPAHWLSFDEARRTFESSVGSGVGFVLAEQPVCQAEGKDLYLVALDFDHCVERTDELNELWCELGQPFVEVSPSGKGLHMFALSTMPPKGGNDYGGHEMYSRGRFMTVTGASAQGQLMDCTADLARLERQWFKTPDRAGQAPSDLMQRLGGGGTPETDDQIQRVTRALGRVSADCSYERWRDIVWAVMSTQWSRAEAIAKEWSGSVPRRFEEDAFNRVVNSFDPSRGIGLGTLFYHAGPDTTWGLLDLPTDLDWAGEVATAEPRDQRPYRLLRPQDIKNLPPVEWLVKGVLPRRGFAAIYGPSGSGKSFLALDLAAHIACGTPWFGIRTTSAPVVYVMLEGVGGLRARVEAWEREHGPPNEKNSCFCTEEFRLGDIDDIERLGQSVPKGGVVIVDTLNRAAPTMDENSSGDMGKVLVGAKRLQELVDGVVIVIHHTGKDQSRGLRGHSSLHASLDAAIEVTRIDNQRAWKIAKAKDAEDGGEYPFRLKRHVLGKDADGDDITSNTIEPGAPGMKKPKEPSGALQKLAIRALRKATAASQTTGKAGALPTTPCLTVNDAITAVSQALTGVDKKKRVNRAKQQISSLTAGGYLISKIENEEEWVALKWWSQ
jgi:hypothetical protein